MKNITVCILCVLLVHSLSAQTPISESSFTSRGYLHSSVRTHGMVSVSPSATIGQVPQSSFGAGTAVVQGSMTTISQPLYTPFTNDVPGIGPRRIVTDNDDDDDWGYGGGGTGQNTGDPMQDKFNPITGDELLMLYAVIFAIGIVVKRYIQKRKAQKRLLF